MVNDGPAIRANRPEQLNPQGQQPSARVFRRHRCGRFRHDDADADHRWDPVHKHAQIAILQASPQKKESLPEYMAITRTRMAHFWSRMAQK
jgi:hypothetical protein